jgi:hypothetical protein
VEELLEFLFVRLDDDGFATLVAHEPRQMLAPYIETGGGRCEQRSAGFVGCVSCSEIISGGYGDYQSINVEAWPCRPVRELAARYADAAEYNEGWRPEYAGFVSGKLLSEAS